jgi:hypothetical protein
VGDRRKEEEGEKRSPYRGEQIESHKGVCLKAFVNPLPLS